MTRPRCPPWERTKLAAIAERFALLRRRKVARATRLAPGVPGGTIPVRLVDDDLANSLANGGRLDTLLGSAELVTSRDVDPDGAVKPGQLAVVKVHTRWRSAAWWVGQTLANALDIGLYQ